MNGATIEGALPDAVEQMSATDRWILSRLNETVAEVDAYYEDFQFAKLADALYHFAWDEVFDWYVELSKTTFFAGGEPAKVSGRVLGEVLDVTLRLLHPIVPFVTETLWTTLTGGESVVIADWPNDSGFRDEAAEREIELVQQVVTEVRRFRADQGLQPGQKVPARLTLDGTALAPHEAAIRQLLRLQPEGEGFRATATLPVAGATVALDLSGTIDVGRRAQAPREGPRRRREGEGPGQRRSSATRRSWPRPRTTWSTRSARRLAKADEDIARITAQLDEPAAGVVRHAKGPGTATRFRAPACPRPSRGRSGAAKRDEVPELTSDGTSGPRRRDERPWMMEGMLRLPTVPALRRCADRWAVSPRALDVVAALSAFGLMCLDVPGLARADNSLTGVTATLVLAAGAATLVLRRRLPWVPYLVALVLMGWLHELTMIQFALYSIGRYRGRRAAVAATLLYVGVAYALFQTPGWPARHGDTLSDFLSLVVPIGVLAAGVGIAAYRQDLVRALEVQRREAVARQAVQEERISVGRDVTTWSAANSPSSRYGPRSSPYGPGGSPTRRTSRNWRTPPARPPHAQRDDRPPRRPGGGHPRPGGSRHARRGERADGQPRGTDGRDGGQGALAAAAGGRPPGRPGVPDERRQARAGAAGDGRDHGGRPRSADRGAQPAAEDPAGPGPRLDRYRPVLDGGAGHQHGRHAEGPTRGRRLRGDGAAAHGPRHPLTHAGAGPPTGSADRLRLPHHPLQRVEVLHTAPGPQRHTVQRAVRDEDRDTGAEAIRRSRPGSSAPPPVSTMPCSMTSPDSSGGHSSRVCGRRR